MGLLFMTPSGQVWEWPKQERVVVVVEPRVLEGMSAEESLKVLEPLRNSFASAHGILSMPGQGGACWRFNAPLKKLEGVKSDPLVKKVTSAEVGDLDDGGVYVGLSAEDGRPLHCALADLPECKTYEEALAAAEQLKSLHPTAHVPTPKELHKNLFDNRNTGHLKGTFNTSGSYPGGIYRSSASSDNGYVRVQWFDDGSKGNRSRDWRLPVRLVW